MLDAVAPPCRSLSTLKCRKGVSTPRCPCQCDENRLTGPQLPWILSSIAVPGYRSVLPPSPSSHKSNFCRPSRAKPTEASKSHRQRAHACRVFHARPTEPLAQHREQEKARKKPIVLPWPSRRQAINSSVGKQPKPPVLVDPPADQRPSSRCCLPSLLPS